MGCSRNAALPIRYLLHERALKTRSCLTTEFTILIAANHPGQVGNVVCFLQSADEINLSPAGPVARPRAAFRIAEKEKEKWVYSGYTTKEVIHGEESFHVLE
jgi:hypothetical protein